jgi:hypothetical protein
MAMAELCLEPTAEGEIDNARTAKLMLPTKSWAKRGMLLGVATGVLLIVIVLVIAFTGEDPPGGTGERVMGMSILLTRVGGPLSYALVEGIDRFDRQSWLLDLALPLTLLTIVVNWALIGGAIGWAASRIAHTLGGRSALSDKH